MLKDKLNDRTGWKTQLSRSSLNCCHNINGLWPTYVLLQRSLCTVILKRSDSLSNLFILVNANLCHQENVSKLFRTFETFQTAFYFGQFVVHTKKVMTLNIKV